MKVNRDHKNTKYVAILVGLVSLLAFPVQGDDMPALNLNIGLSDSFLQAPAINHYPTNDYMSLYNGETDMSLKLSKQYPLGLVRFKAGKSMRIRGWQVSQNIYFGQAKVGKKWGLGLVLDRGSHYYGINHRGLSYLKKF